MVQPHTSAAASNSEKTADITLWEESGPHVGYRMLHSGSRPCSRVEARDLAESGNFISEHEPVRVVIDEIDGKPILHPHTRQFLTYSLAC